MKYRIPTRWTLRSGILAASLVLSHPGWPQDTTRPEIGDVLQKGVVGKALDAVPMDSDQRLRLQRANAVVSNTLTGRSLAAWVGISNPILMVAGLVYGLYSASRIKAVGAEAAASTLTDKPARVDVAEDTPRPAAD